MEGRYPSGILVTLTRCKNPQEEEEFSHWYRTVHLADVEASGAVEHAALYRNAAAAPVQIMPQDSYSAGSQKLMRNESIELSPGEVQHLAVYESKWPDLHAVSMAVLRNQAHLSDMDRIHPGMDMVLQVYYARIGPEFRTDRSGRAVRGILVVLGDRKEKVPGEAVDEWYNNTHIPEILATGLYHTAYRYQAHLQVMDNYSTVPELAALYETDQDPLVTADILLGYKDKWTLHQTHGSVVNVRMRGAFSCI